MFYIIGIAVAALICAVNITSNVIGGYLRLTPKIVIFGILYSVFWPAMIVAYLWIAIYATRKIKKEKDGVQ